MAASAAAERMAEQEATMMLPPGLEPPPGLELPCKSMAPPPGLEKVHGEHKPSLLPMYVPTLLCPQPVLGATVKVSSLPNHILSRAMMSATLDQAGLDKRLVDFTTKPGAQRGEALITFTDPDAAIRCAHHFNGRRWDASGITVSAQLLPMQAPRKPAGVFKVPKKTNFALSATAAEFVPGAWSLPAPVKETPTPGSDVSTEDGDSASSSDEKESKEGTC